MNNVIITATALSRTVACGKYDGISTYTRNILYELTLRGVSYNLLIFGKLRKISEFNCIYISAPRLHILRILYSMFPLAVKYFWKLKVQTRILHVTDHFVPPYHSGKLVITVHDLIPITHPWLLPASYIKKSLPALCEGISRADLIVAVSNDTKNSIIEYFGIDSRKVKFIPNGVAEDFFLIDYFKNINIVSSYGLSESYICSIGLIQPRKNFVNLVKAYNLLPDYVKDRANLVIIGSLGWNDEYNKIFLELLKSSPNVIWLQNISNDHVISILQSSNGFVMPSLAEGFGLPVLEAMASRVPVAIADIPALNEVLCGCGDRFDPTDVPNITNALSNLISCYGTKKSNDSVKVAYSIASNFTWKKTAEQLNSIYESFKHS